MKQYLQTFIKSREKGGFLLHQISSDVISWFLSVELVNNIFYDYKVRLSWKQLMNKP